MLANSIRFILVSKLVEDIKNGGSQNVCKKMLEELIFIKLIPVSQRWPLK